VCDRSITVNLHVAYDRLTLGHLPVCLQQKVADDAHKIAQTGDVRGLKRLANTGRKALHKPDNAGWHPLHEAVRAGHVEAVQFLLLNGADVNVATNSGHSALGIAKTYLGAHHQVTKLLMEIGAVELGPDL
jgi:ankyrin repeat protein